MLFFSKRFRKGADRHKSKGTEELRESEGGKVMIRICYMKTLFSMKQNTQLKSNFWNCFLAEGKVQLTQVYNESKLELVAHF